MSVCPFISSNCLSANIQTDESRMRRNGWLRRASVYSKAKNPYTLVFWIPEISWVFTSILTTLSSRFPLIRIDIIVGKTWTTRPSSVVLYTFELLCIWIGCVWLQSLFHMLLPLDVRHRRRRRRCPLLAGWWMDGSSYCRFIWLRFQIVSAFNSPIHTPTLFIVVVVLAFQRTVVLMRNSDCQLQFFLSVQIKM